MIRFSSFQKCLTAMILMLFLIAGCAWTGPAQKPTITPPQMEELPSGSGWWVARFHLAWPPDTKPVWYLDLCLAHQVIAPQLALHEKDIYLWRFHRRAARDASGRMFSFIFYAAPRTAEQIFSALQTDPLVRKLMDEGVLERTEYDNPARIERPNIEDTSDRQWPVPIQKTWPYYIMGASRMWLNLIAEVAAEYPEDFAPTSSKEIEAYYQQIDKTILELWQQEGRHAFMHHLNALFEYEPIIYREKRYLNF